jgi:RimJ/RimL family protein N-acetyltransferase
MIETERLLLRPHRLDDLDAAASMYADPAVMRFVGGVALGREDVWHRLLRYAGHWALLHFGLWAIEERATGRFIGEAGFADFHRDLGPRFDGAPEAAWILAEGAQGRGYAHEAMTAATRWLDRYHPAGRAVCMINPDNAPSLRLAARLGFASMGGDRYRGRPVLLWERLTPA